MLAGLTLLRLWFVGRFELSPDEAYYWTWSRHLDWSYYDQGPMLALVIRFFTALAGTATESSVRLGAVVLSGLTSWIFFSLSRRIFGDSRTAWEAFLGLQAALLFSAGSLLMMHDTIMMLFWVGGLYAFYRALMEDWTPGWALGALALGLGGLSKYTMALFVPCLLLFLAASPRQRVWWRRPHLYLTGLAAGLMTWPVWFWNHRNGWASFGHIGDLSGAHKVFTLSYKTFLEFVGGQAAVMTPLIGVFCLAAPVIAWRLWRRRKENGEAYLFLACFSAPVVLFFAALSLQTRIYANWAAPAYPAALIILAGWLKGLRGTPRARTARNWTAASLLLGAVLTLIAHLEAGWGILPLTGRAASSVDRIRGWRETGDETGRRLAALTAGGRPPALAARRYQIAAVLSFYVPGQPEVQLFPDREPATNQYRFWDRSERLEGRDVLFVCEDAWEADHLRSRFRQLEELDPYLIRRGTRTVRELRYFLGRDYRPRERPAVGYAHRGSGEAVR